MSVVVNMQISIADGMAHRQLTISRVSNVGVEGFGENVNDMVSTYFVETGRFTATFHHRYGDDALTLINKATAALRNAGMKQI